MKRTVGIIFLVVIWTCSCGPDTDTETEAVQHTTLKYDQLLAEGYAKMDMTSFQKVATELRALKAYHHMSVPVHPI